MKQRTGIAFLLPLALACLVSVSNCGQGTEITAAAEMIIMDDTTGLKRLHPDAWLARYGLFLNRDAFADGAYGGDGINIVGVAGAPVILTIDSKSGEKAVWEVLAPGLFDSAMVINKIRGARRNFLVEWTCSVIGEMAAETYFTRSLVDTMKAIVSFPAKGEPTIWLSQAPDHLALQPARKHWTRSLSKKPAPF